MSTYDIRYVTKEASQWTFILEWLRILASFAMVLVIVWIVILSVVQVYTIMVPGTYEFMQSIKWDKAFYSQNFQHILSEDESSSIVKIFKAVIFKVFLVVGCIIVFRILLFR